jgi:hypothetical protein
MMMQKFKEALVDCQISLQIDSTHEKVKKEDLYKESI